ncbi:lipoprotein BA_5634 family protein [Lactococcus garvieae]|uniref:lipoprotein BA_5634 family protein n=1 Tax=Lactococcus garvieae TaxID=1363 RepID=UPI0009BE7317|nr:lipoprotein BA_5634 family protein [Lactococcus garvieae]
MKKAFWLIPALVIFIAGGYFTVSKVIEVFHQPVHGIILYSRDKSNLDQGLKENQPSIKNHIDIKGKYIEKTDTLVLNTNSAKKLIKAKAVNKVSKKNDEYTFKHIQSLSKTPSLWTANSKIKNISDEKGQGFTAEINEYVVLGESSITKKTLILDEKDFQRFQAPTEYLSVIEEKRDAAYALTHYKFDKSQIFNFDQK